MPSLKEKIILLKLESGNTKVFKRVYDLYVEKIYRFIFFKVSNEQEAEDLTSEVFLRAWQYIKDGKEIKSLNAFLYSIARNKVIDLYRKRGKTKQISLDNTSVCNIKDEKLDQQENLDIKIQKQNMIKFLDQLKTEYKEILILRYVDDFSIAEIADILGKRKGNVRVLIYRALEALREIMGGR